MSNSMANKICFDYFDTNFGNVITTYTDGSVSALSTDYVFYIHFIYPLSTISHLHLPLSQQSHTL